MKKLDKALIIIFSLILFASVVLSSALVIAASPAIYKSVLIKTDTVSVSSAGALSVKLDDFGGKTGVSATLNNGQTEALINHIPKYLFDFSGKKDFSLTIEKVVAGGVLTENAPVFGEIAIEHMAEVKLLLKYILITDIILITLLVLIIVYFFKRKSEIKPILFKYSAATYIGIAALFAVFFIWCGFSALLKYDEVSAAAFFDTVWDKLHYIFFMFNGDAISGSFFNDSLTSLLNLSFFTEILKIIVGILILIIVVSLSAFAFWRYRKKQA